ncbi:MAG: hypothetical protein E6H96_12330 [Chloroflexi bacterium]|nr:MAG: hypothetical protein E6H96_12330 [Chloroflexota bacterium]
MTLPIHDRVEAEALLTDHYLESLLAAHDRHAQDIPFDTALDSDVRRAAAKLRSNLTRVHPSFRFEERLAASLAEAAARLRLAPAAGGESGARRYEGLDYDPADRDIQMDPHDGDPTPRGRVTHPSRPLLIGGALTSAALSIAGAAYVAWRRSRPTSSAMERAVRLAHRQRAVRAASGAIARRGLD